MAPAVGGRIVPTHFTFAIDTLARDAQTPAYELPVEEAYMVLDGVLDVERFDSAGVASTQRLGARDLALVPAGVRHRIVNRDAGTVRFATIVGSLDARPIAWDDALAVSHA
jgi:oxalate decarboxylase/phosphoglucose isomerase-like protein (cupin superfamily)